MRATAQRDPTIETVVAFDANPLDRRVLANVCAALGLLTPAEQKAMTPGRPTRGRTRMRGGAEAAAGRGRRVRQITAASLLIAHGLPSHRSRRTPAAVAPPAYLFPSPVASRGRCAALCVAAKRHFHTLCGWISNVYAEAVEEGVVRSDPGLSATFYQARQHTRRHAPAIPIAHASSTACSPVKHLNFHGRPSLSPDSIASADDQRHAHPPSEQELTRFRGAMVNVSKRIEEHQPNSWTAIMTLIVRRAATSDDAASQFSRASANGRRSADVASLEWQVDIAVFLTCVSYPIQLVDTEYSGIARCLQVAIVEL